MKELKRYFSYIGKYKTAYWTVFLFTLVSSAVLTFAYPYMNKLILLVFCHLVGDYVLQNDFIAKNKGSNWYHLFVHCALYCLPFYLAFGLTWQLGVVFLTHCIIDPLKARYQKISYVTDQILHYFVSLVYFL